MNYLINRVDCSKIVFNIILFFLYFLSYDVSIAQEWKRLEDSKVPRVEALGASLGEKVYIFSGFNEYTDEILRVTSTSEVFDPSLIPSGISPWKEIAPIPIPVTHVGAVVVGSSIWFPGGFAGNDPGYSIKNVQIYDTKTNTWSDGPSLPEPLASHAAVRLGNYFHVFGGLLPDRQTDTGVHYVLDLSNQGDGWKKAAPLPFPRNHLSGVALAGKIYAIGGQFGHDEAWSDQRFLHEYDPISDKWTRKADLPLDRSHFEPGTISKNGKIIIVGGRNRKNDVILDKITEYDPDLDKWKELDPLPKRLLAPVAKIIDDKMYVTHGGDTWKDPYKTAYERPHYEKEKDLLGVWPTEITETGGKDSKINKKFSLWTFNKITEYKIETTDLPEWIKINETDISDLTGPEGRFIEIMLDAISLNPGHYEYEVKASAEGLAGISIPVSLTVPDPDIIRINAGGGSVVADEMVFIDDKYFTSGKSYSNSNVSDIQGTSYNDLYLEERSAVSDEKGFSYNIPVKNGNYKVKLHFAEIYWGATGGGKGENGKRIFDVNIEGGPIELKDYDIFNEVGSMTAQIKEFEINVSDERLDIDFLASVDQPKVSAIEVIPFYDDLKTLQVEHGKIELSVEQGKEEVRTNTITTSDLSQQTIFLNAESNEGNRVDWITLEGQPLHEYSSLSGSDLIFNIETNDLLPGVYSATVTVTAVNYLPVEFNVDLEVTAPNEPGLPQLKISANDLVYSSIVSKPSEKGVRISNFGSAPLLVSSLFIEEIESNTNAFSTQQDVPFEIPPYEFIDLKILFSPSRPGAFHGTLTIDSNDPENPSSAISLSGLAANGLEGKLEPTLYQISDVLGYKTNIGFTTLESDTKVFPMGDEVIAKDFRKAGSGNVKIVPVARYSPLESLIYGYYIEDQSGSLDHVEVGALSIVSPQHQTLFPEVISGITEFDPGNSLFGIYTQSPLHNLYLGDTYNSEIETSVNHAVRIYPLIDKNGNVLENQYLVCFEEASNGDYQDYVFIISNVVPINCLVDFELSVKNIESPNCEKSKGNIEIGYNTTKESLEFSIDEGREYQESAIFNDLDPGKHLIFAREIGSKDCIDFLEFEMPESEELFDFTVSTTPVSCEKTSDGSASIQEIHGGQEPYTIEWAFSESTESTVTNLSPGDYTVTLTDSKGCQRTHEFKALKQDDCPSHVWYREVFGNSTRMETPLEEVGWKTYKGPSALFVAELPSEYDKATISPFSGMVASLGNVNAGLTTDTVNGFFTATINEVGPILTITDEFQFNLHENQITSISWYQGHSSAGFRTHVVLNISGQWFVSKKGFSNATNVQVDPHFASLAEKQKFDFTVSGHEWHALDLIPGERLDVGSLVSQAGLPFNVLPEETLLNFGLLTFADEPGSIRFDTYEIEVNGVSSLETTVTDLNAHLTAEKIAVITWKTTSEKNNFQFVLEKSKDSSVYETVSITPGAGNSSSTINYELIDSLPFEGKTYYRLRFNETDESAQYTNVVYVDIGSEVITDVNIYPNPSSGRNIEVEMKGLGINQDVFIRVTELSGKVLFNHFFKSDNVGRLYDSLVFDSVLSPGVYILLGKSGTFSFNYRIIIK